MYGIDLANDFDSDRPIATKNALLHFYFWFVVDYALNTLLRRVNGIGTREHHGVDLATLADTKHCIG